MAGLGKPGAGDRLRGSLARCGGGGDEREAARRGVVARRRANRADPHTVRRGLAAAPRLGCGTWTLSAGAGKTALAGPRGAQLDGPSSRCGDAGEPCLGRPWRVDARPAGDLHLAADFCHLLAVGLWLGTLPPLIMLLAEARRSQDANWKAVVARATRRYSAMAIASVAVLLTAGIFNTWFLAGTVPAPVGTEYGRLLLAKIGLFIAMLMVAAVNLLRLAPRLARPALAPAMSSGGPSSDCRAMLGSKQGSGLGSSLSSVSSAPCRPVCIRNPRGHSRSGSTSAR
jgi:uncharacterized membrane protein